MVQAKTFSHLNKQISVMKKDFKKEKKGGFYMIVDKT